MDQDSLKSLVEGTDFNFLSSDDVTGFSDRPLVSTPCETLNCFLGGGVPLGAIVEAFGGNTAGKSSFSYEVLGRFQKEYPEGLAIIIDSETSLDLLRLQALGVNTKSLLILPSKTLEDGFEQMDKILTKKSENKKLKKVPVFIIWDTISACPTRAQSNGSMYAGGMAEAARIIKAGLKNIFMKVAEQNVLLIILNQVVAEIGGYRPKLGSGGGNALNVA